MSCCAVATRSQQSAGLFSIATSGYFPWSPLLSRPPAHASRTCGSEVVEPCPVASPASLHPCVHNVYAACIASGYVYGTSYALPPGICPKSLVRSPTFAVPRLKPTLIAAAVVASSSRVSISGEKATLSVLVSLYRSDVAGILSTPAGWHRPAQLSRWRRHTALSLAYPHRQHCQRQHCQQPPPSLYGRASSMSHEGAKATFGPGHSATGTGRKGAGSKAVLRTKSGDELR